MSLSRKGFLANQNPKAKGNPCNLFGKYNEAQ